MITLELIPDHIQLEQTTEISLRIVNVSKAPLIKLQFLLETPKHLLLLGQQKGVIDLLEPGQAYEFTLYLQGKQIGTSELMCTRLSYRTVYGQVHHQLNNVLKLQVVEPHTPSVNLILQPLSCLLDNWTQWKGTISNQSKVLLKNIKFVVKEKVIELYEPVLIDELQIGESKTVVMVVRAHETGPHVPVSLVVHYEEITGYRYKLLFSQSLEVNRQMIFEAKIDSSSFYTRTLDVQRLDNNTITKEENVIVDRDRFLYGTLMKHFNLSEIADLCFHLGIDYEDLLGSSKSEKIRELILFCERHSLNSQLIDIIHKRHLTGTEDNEPHP